MVTVTTNCIDFLLALPILVLLLITDDVVLHPLMLALPIVIVLQFVLTLGLTYLIATANVIFRDTEHIVGVVLETNVLADPNRL